jgi:hypothetical protein
MSGDDLKDISGGGHSQRGYLSQTYSVLLYFLARRIHYPNLQLVVEPGIGEDALFIYPPDAGLNSGARELVQCKKRESAELDNVHLGFSASDRYAEGRIRIKDLELWTAKPRLLDAMSGNTELYMTFLTFGKFDEAIRAFRIPGCGSLADLAFQSRQEKTVFPPDYAHVMDPAPRLKSVPEPFSSPCLNRQFSVWPENI